jgi:hypothetical protein
MHPFLPPRPAETLLPLNIVNKSSGAPARRGRVTGKANFAGAAALLFQERAISISPRMRAAYS